MADVEVPPGTIALYSDILCGWATVALDGLRRARSELGLDDEVRIDNRLFLLEDVNRFPIPKLILDSEIPVYGTMAPDFGFRMWTGEVDAWPVSSLLANEAVWAAKDQGPVAAEELDFALRKAFFAEGRCITMRHVVLEVAAGCSAVDAGAIEEALDDGRARGPMMADYRARRDDVEGSPHFFFADGHDVHNPGVEHHTEGELGKGGYPVIDAHDRDVYRTMVERAATTA